MKLPREFIRLPLRFDADRLAQEVHALPRGAWQAHPLRYQGNSAVPLISVKGENNDFFAGPMAQTEWLRKSPYLRQVLASFGVVFGRSRLMGLAGGNEVPAHCDINYHWFGRIRIHVPIITFPEVSFHCHDQVVHMAAGEAWIFDNWKIHRVVNPTRELRVHLVADTVGSARFWQWVRQAQENPEAAATEINYRDEEPEELLLERYNTPDVMHPAEAELLSEDLITDLLGSDAPNPETEVQRFVVAVRSFCADWRSLWSQYADDQEAWSRYAQRRDQLMRELIAIRTPLIIAVNQRVAQRVMYARVLVACVHLPMQGSNEIQYGS